MADTPGADGAQPTGAALLASPVRRALVDALAGLDDSQADGLTAAELGDRLDLHTTTIRFHVDQLVAAGVLQSHFVRRAGVGRPSKKYAVRKRPPGETVRDSSGGSPHEVLAGLLTSVLAHDGGEQLTPEEAGAQWARRRADEASPPGEPTSRTAKVAHVIDLLGEWGYTPETDPDEDGVDVTLRQCPFLDLAHAHPDVVCGVHRGLLKGALTGVGEPGARVTLHPFVGPDTCLARIYIKDDQHDQRSA